MMQRILVLFLLILFCKLNYAQEFGGNPSSIKWNQVNTNESRIIFPAGLDSSAKRISNIISYLTTSTFNTIGNRNKKINLVLQNQTTISNAYVALGPFRSEFFLTPLQNSFELGSLPWTDQLAIHEFRHVQQYNNFNVGLSKFLHFLFGEEGQALANNGAIPNWFFEGDAVYNETNVSQQGRGRLPWFFNAYRSLWKVGKNYNWMKLRNGSFRDFIPDHYALGYLLVAYGREKYGDEFWKNVTQDAAAFKGLFYPFQAAIKKYSGKDYGAFRNDALNYFRNILNSKTEANNDHYKEHQFIDEEFPVVTGKGIIYMRSGYKLVPAFVIRSGNVEKKIRTRDVSLDNQFSFRNGKIVYTSYQPDSRWGYRDFTDVQLIDVETGNQRTLTHHGKYFSPDISEDGKKVVAVQVSPNGNSVLQVINTGVGTAYSIPNPEGLFYTYPKFYGENILSAVRNKEGKMSLGLTDASGMTRYLTPFSFNVIGFPYVFNDTVYFSASHGTEDRLFAITPLNKIFLLHSADVNGIGNYQVSLNGNKIYWTTFTANGFRIQQSDINGLQWIETTPQEFAGKNSDFGVSALQKTNSNLLASVPDKPLPVTPYHKSFSLINFHSLIPAVDDPDYSLTLISDNILNTLESELSFDYNRSERFKKISFNTVYAGWFPFLSAGIDYTIDRRGRYHGKTVFWNEVEPGAGFNIPLNLSKGRSLAFLNFGSRFIYNSSTFQGQYKDTFGTPSYSYISNFLGISNRMQSAVQNIFPHFAQTLSFSYKTTVTHYNGSQFLVNGNLYFPGFLRNHSIVLNGAYLTKDTLGQLNFSSGFPFSRGYTSVNLHEMLKLGVNYHLPLLYPDAGIGNIVYFLRVRGNVFYDYTHVNDFFTNRRVFSADFRSVGGEVFFDTKWWNEAPVTFGVRYSHLLDNDLFGGITGNRWEIILPVNIFQR